MLTLSTLLDAAGLDPAKTVVMRHRPFEPSLRRVFSGIARTRPDLMDAYQRTQFSRAEGAMTRADHLVCCIGETSGEALFIGVFDINAYWTVKPKDEYAEPDVQELVQLGLNQLNAERDEIIRFDLSPRDNFADYEKRLILNWPGLERAWYRWADRNSFDITAYLPAEVSDPEMPSWKGLELSIAEIKTLPQTWRTKLGQWRGVYYIFDTALKQGYVGSAGGGDNIHGRWLGYVTNGHGGNAGLRKSDPKALKFSILERVSPDMPQVDLIAIENGWKDRLHTRKYGLNRN